MVSDIWNMSGVFQFGSTSENSLISLMIRGVKTGMISPEEESCVFNLERVLIDSIEFHSVTFDTTAL